MTSRADLGDTCRSVSRALIARKWRTVLMASGAVVGSLTVTATLGLGMSSTEKVRSEVERLGSRLVLVTVSGAESTEDAGVWRQLALDLDLDNVSSMSESSYVPGITNGDLPYIPAGGTLIVWDSTLPATLDLSYTSGGPIDPASAQLKARVAVVGNAIGDLLKGQPTPARIRLNDMEYLVVGVLSAYPALPSIDRAIFIPDPGEFVDLGVFEDGTGVLRAPSAETAATYGSHATTLLRLRYPDGSVRVEYARDLVTVSAAITPVVRFTAYGAGLLSAVLGSFAILNVLLMSVTERRREIGLRLALGHPRRHVGLLFLFEGAMVGLAGSLAGCLSGVGVIWLCSAFIPDWEFAVAPPEVMLAIVVISVALSIIAAAIPGRLAMNMDPVESLQLG